MTLTEFLEYLNSGKTVIARSEVHQFMCMLSQEALKLTTKLNNSYCTPEEIHEIFSELTGQSVDESFSMFPPFYTDCGKNIHVGKPALYQGLVEGFQVCGLLLDEILQFVDAGNLCVPGSSVNRAFFSLFSEFEDLVGNLIIRGYQVACRSFVQCCKKLY